MLYRTEEERGGREAPRPDARALASTEEWRELLQSAGLEVEQELFFAKTHDFDEWLARTGCEGADAERVRELLVPYSSDDGTTWANDYIVVKARKSQNAMAIIVDNDTKLVVSGLTGSEGRFHGLRNRAYGTNVVAGVTPGQGRPGRRGHPGLQHGRRRRDARPARTRRMIFVPARFAPDAIYEAVDAGIQTVICITEHIPAHEMLRVHTYVRPKGVTLIGPNCPGVLSPGKANVGIIPAEVFKPGEIGLVSRSGTLTYQIGNELAERGLGNSTIVGIGGDPVVGSSFIDVLEKFEADPETKMVVLVGEIGGDEEEKAAR